MDFIRPFCSFKSLVIDMNPGILSFMCDGQSIKRSERIPTAYSEFDTYAPFH